MVRRAPGPRRPPELVSRSSGRRAARRRRGAARAPTEPGGRRRHAGARRARRRRRALSRARRSLTSAATSPSGVCSAASTSGSKPSSRSAALVTGPIETSRGPSSVPAAAWKKRTDEALGERRVVGARAPRRGPRRPAARRPCGRARATSTSAPRVAQRVGQDVAGLLRRARSARGGTGSSASASTSASADRRARARCRARCRARAAPRAVPGPIDRDRRPGERARVAARGAKSCVDAVGRGQAEQVVGRRGRASSTAQRLDADRRRLDDVGAERRAAAPRAPLACARARVTATVRPASGPRRRARRARRRAPRPGPTTVIDGGAHCGVRARSAIVASVARTRALVGQRPALDDRHRLVRRRGPPAISCSAMRGSWRTPM